MAAKIRITGGGDSARSHGVEARVTPEGELVVAQSATPPLLEQKARPFRQYFTVDGLTTGSNDMGIDGSSTNVDFYIPAAQVDRYITYVNIIVGYGTSAQPFQFADSTALTNGIRFFYESLRGAVDIHDGIKSNQDFFRLSEQFIPTSWEVRGVNASNDYGFFIPIDLRKFIPPYGIKLDKDTNQRMVLCVRDNASNADTLNAIAYGFERFE